MDPELIQDDQFQRTVRFTPAYDKHKEGYGIHGVDMHMVLLGPEGAIEFVVWTGWHWLETEGPNEAKGVDVDFHARAPVLDATLTRKHCKILDGSCYASDGSSLRAKPIFDALLKEGSDGVWRMMREEYDSTFTEANREKARDLARGRWASFLKHMKENSAAFPKEDVDAMGAELAATQEGRGS